MSIFSYKYDFSIVMGYYNRKTQVKRTLDKFADTYKDYNYEVIIVDDNSTLEHALDEVVKEYSYPIKYIKISAEEKGNRINPSVVYNKGFREAEGKIVIIQNPECIHMGNLLGKLKTTLTYNEYIAFSAYNCTSEELTVRLLNDINLINDQEYNNLNVPCWYNHPTRREVHFHFCAAMMNDNLKLLGGFDETLADGAWFDDDEILLSIKNKMKLNIRTLPPEAGFVIHQWHARDAESKFTKEQHNALIDKNRQIMTKYREAHAMYNFPFPKLAHFYWDGSNFSYLNLMTIISFNRHHTAWRLNVFCPKNPTKVKSWKGDEQKEEYTGKDYFDELKKIPNLTIHYIDTDSLPFTHKTASEIIKSDFFRLYVLNKYGGLWSDFDIIYTGNVEKYHVEKMSGKNANKSMVLYRYPIEGRDYNIFPVGLFLSQKNNSILGTIIKNIDMFYNPDSYQSLGCQMFQFIFNKQSYKDAKDILKQMKLPELFFGDANCYLPIKWNELDNLYVHEDRKIEEFEGSSEVFGIHWFNGATASKQYCNNLDIENAKKTQKCLVDKFIAKYSK